LEQNSKALKLQYVPFNYKFSAYSNENDAEIRNGHHIHHQFEMVLVESGKIRFTVEGGQIDLSAGEVILINNYVVHSNYPLEAETKLVVFHFSDEDSSKSTSNYSNRFIIGYNRKFVKTKLFGDEEKGRTLARIVIDVLNSKHINSEGEELIVKGTFYQLFGILQNDGVLRLEAKQQEKAVNKAANKVNKVIEYIEEHFDEDITIESAAQIMNVNPSYFCRIFKQEMGNTFVHYLNDYRIMQAKQRLLKPEASITEVMYETGFSNYSYFNRVFKQYSGCSPTDYKLKYIKEWENPDEDEEDFGVFDAGNNNDDIV
jgi:AraC-like DNA-binding protein